MTDQEADLRKTALSLALQYPGGAIGLTAPGALEARAERFRAFLMGEWKAEEKTDAA